MSDAEINPGLASPPLTGFTGSIPMDSQFVFMVDQVTIGAFSEVSGLEIRAEVVTYNEGGQNGFAWQFPGRFTWPNITLKQGVINTDNLFQWVSKTSGSGFASNGNKLTYCTGALQLRDSDDTTVLREWKFLHVFPVRWAGPRFALGSNEQANEELEIVHQGFSSTTPGS